MTHDLVHGPTHFGIFQLYYPATLPDWWMDDWVSKVYGRRRTQQGPFSVVHHTKHNKASNRYAVNMDNMKFLGRELRRGRKKIERYVSVAADKPHLVLKANEVWGGGR
jgi:hypothetical protein